MAKTKLNILILGGHGFVGKNLTVALKNSEHVVISKSRKDGVDALDFQNIRNVNGYKFSLSHTKLLLAFANVRKRIKTEK